MANKNLHQLKQDFLTYMEVEKGRSVKTIHNYNFYLDRFFKWAKISKPSEITLEKVKSFRLYLNRLPISEEKTISKNTQNYHLIALRSFLKYLAKADIKTLAGEKIELAKMSERQIDFLEGEDLERLLEAPLKTKEAEVIKRRDKAILELLFATGLRVSELADLEREDINLKKDEFSVKGKGGKIRVVFLSLQAKESLADYLKTRQDISEGLFVRHDRARGKIETDEKLTPRSIQRLIKKYSRVAGITKKVSPHTMRHSFATDLLASGADIRSVQTMLGHASITTTQVYTHITDKRLRDIYKRFHNRRK